MVIRRLLLVVCALVALDFLLLGFLSRECHWGIPLAITILATILGFVVIIYYERRWSEVVAKSLEEEPGLLDRASLEKILLLIAGIVFLIPGILTDVLALILLIPSVRRQIVRNCPLKKT
jgi:UPF0716 protein FxsA